MKKRQNPNTNKENNSAAAKFRKHFHKEMHEMQKKRVQIRFAYADELEHAATKVCHTYFVSLRSLNSIVGQFLGHSNPSRTLGSCSSNSIIKLHAQLLIVLQFVSWRKLLKIKFHHFLQATTKPLEYFILTFGLGGRVASPHHASSAILILHSLMRTSHTYSFTECY